MKQIIRHHRIIEYKTDETPLNNAARLLRGEWLITNGLGGYASNSVAGITTRKYHGYLVAALPPPYGRTIMLNHLHEEVITADGQTFIISCDERSNGNISLTGMSYLQEFYLDYGLPVWRYHINDIIIEKRIILIYQQNTIQITYKLISGCDNVYLNIQPSFNFRPHEAPVSKHNPAPYQILAIENRYEITFDNHPPLRLFLHGQNVKFVLQENHIPDAYFRMEEMLGYECLGQLWTPGYFNLELQKGYGATLVASTEKWETITALKPEDALPAELARRRHLLSLAQPEAQNEMGAELILAADKFIITPLSRFADAVRARAEGNEAYTIIAGYHWFTDWGRDTMISLEGLTLCTGRHKEGLWILKTFCHYVKDGLIPNMFPEGIHEGLYHTADATLWFFHALDRYLDLTQNYSELPYFLPTLKKIIQFHERGTHFNIGMDANDCLIKQGQEGYQLTWMDAKVGDWVVTPRRGKAVEINALWYNALKLMAEWTQNSDTRASQHYQELAHHVYQSFNQKFWLTNKGYLYDVIEGEIGNDDALRPNQLFAISLKYPVLEKNRWLKVIKICQKELLTPYGLRSLAPNHPDYKPYYDGSLRVRDAAYHQGTVWAWLIGPFIDAWIKAYPKQRIKARQFLLSFEQHLEDSGVGSISEVFDAMEPYTPRGCVAQAWSVAEVLRAWIKTAP
ncbi:putative glycogen debranching enzyme, archaeal type [Legionella beliardensis]|uniref:Putative glycogen debranching enzyme, archaeal type n=1 Tax=Legionella beliardensis TaxID=91822 RepID=A0A378I1E5_9GAMM|nr:amylo-alpha-1,6-glucosidase [Legionella beliardensis]STX28772.1 putative glycogen debranching enzyme, archaeal type [Legionella beliardensis]